MVDRGLTHVALPVSNLNDSIAFYTTYARMQVVHRRTVPATGFEVAWLSDQTRPFVVVLSERSQVDHPLVPPAHLGVACASREEVERLCALARGEGRLINGPRDAGPPIGYVAAIQAWGHVALACNPRKRNKKVAIKPLPPVLTVRHLDACSPMHHSP